MKKTIITILVLIIVALAIVLIVKNSKKSDVTNVGYEPVPEVPLAVDTEISGNKEDLVSFSVAAGSKVSGIKTVTGTVKNAYFFEANILVNLADKNKTIIKNGYGMATTDWMTAGPVSFSATIDATSMPKGQGYIVLTEDDPSDGEGGPIKSIWIPVIFE